MKIVATFSLFALLHFAGWGMAHAWLKRNPHETLLVFDTSFSMKPHFEEMWQWANDYSDKNRYTRIVLGTDKEIIGDYGSVRSSSEVFRSVFGKFAEESLDKYKQARKDKKILLSDGEVMPDGWQVVEFR